jgi:membrane protein
VLLVADLGLSLLVVVALFAAIYRILPDVVLSFRDVLPGAVLSAVLFTIGRAVIAEYLARSAPGSAYGAAGSLVVLLIWVNYSSLILLFGAAFNRAYLQHRDMPIVPRRGAVRVKRKLLENTPAEEGSQ